MSVCCGTKWRPVLLVVVVAVGWGVCRIAAAVGGDGAGKPAGLLATTQPSHVVDERLVRKLLGGKSSALDTVATTLARMKEAAGRLSDQLDVGAKTQAVQAEVLAGLDQLIKDAGQSRRGRSRRRHIRRKADQRPRSGSDRRSKAAKAGPTSKGGRGADDDGKRPKPGKEKNTKADLARRWGFLPDRDRMEVSQGFDEEFLPKFREQILRYYRRLAEAAQQE